MAPIQLVQHAGEVRRVLGVALHLGAKGARQPRVKLGKRDGAVGLVKDGLDAKDKILIEGLRLVKEGQEIKYDFKDPKDVISHLDLYAE